MPTYEYRCANGHAFEQFYRTISGSKHSLPCPTCGLVAERLVSGGAGLLFKGSGFYVTDYGKGAHADRGANGASGNHEGGAKPEAGAASNGTGGTAAGSSSGDSGSTKPASGAGATGPAKGSASSTPSKKAD